MREKCVEHYLFAIVFLKSCAFIFLVWGFVNSRPELFSTCANIDFRYEENPLQDEVFFEP